MKILGIDTATMAGSVAIVDGERLLGERLLNVPETHSKRLHLAIDRLLTETRLRLADLDGLAVTRGPGSFTGLRIGMAAAKGLALATGMPLVGVSTLDVLAANFFGCRHLICPVLDAKKKQVFTGLYQCRDTGPVVKVRPEVCVTLEAFLDTLPPEPVIFAGDGPSLYRQRILDHRGSLAIMAPPGLNYLSPAKTAFLGLDELTSGRNHDLDALTPLYIRASDAEIFVQPPVSTGY
ncbi:MAG: tRNA (adenosine(37)-N6)-threonylcarbamoyltransferase complex dimerization subunit type 1 TsaB [Deltaproteobacteria bacterium]|nr:tRNA (adenosine(37)-N6)-threonylcarbamoyltransferase complex dimerization subunit type 1 TsaB [Deltaproteobacteria bacterium]MBF0525296.1 tRNA (adenosine(37)-N6)-threonylcarbamoyltransferase complex dimerization subunit type 1 TsaB [Deltaproteobacteria bacterium]